MTRLSVSQIEQFQEQGYLVVDGLFDPQEDLDPIVTEYHGVLDRLAKQLYARGEIQSDYEALPFSQRLIKVFAEGGRDFTQQFDFCLPQKSITKETPIWLGEAVFNVIRSPRLLDAVESIIGPEIFSNPVQHVRLKTPDHLTPRHKDTGMPVIPNASWHQDNGVVMPEADETEMLTVWCPLSDASEENGCLQLVPNSHRDGVLQHCPNNGILRIPASEFDEGAAIPVPIKKGSGLFMHRRTCHASMLNHSEDIRWSFDLRFNPIGQVGGRDHLPGFVARSRQNPESELHDAATWRQRWYDARDALSVGALPASNRWDASAVGCA